MYASRITSLSCVVMGTYTFRAGPHYACHLFSIFLISNDLPFVTLVADPDESPSLPYSGQRACKQQVLRSNRNSGRQRMGRFHSHWNRKWLQRERR